MSGSAAATAPPAKRWFEKPALSALDRMPLLADVMGEVARAWTARFAGLSSAPGEFQFRGLDRSRIATVALRRRGALLAVVDAAEWRAVLGLQIDRAFAATVVEAMFGGDGQDDAPKDGEPMTAIEARIAEVVSREAAEALAAAFGPVFPATFAVREAQPKPDWSVFGKPAAEVFVATFALQALGRSVTVDLLVPREALEPAADRFAEKPAAASAPRDTGWSRTFEAEVGRAEVSLSACIDLPALSLREIARLRPGQTLALPTAAAADVRLRCASGDLFRCELGQSAGFYTVRIDGEADVKAALARHHDPIQARTAEQR